MTLTFPPEIEGFATWLAERRATLVNQKDREILAVGPGITGEQRQQILNRWMPEIQKVIQVQVDIWLRFGLFGWKEVVDAE